MNESVLTIIGVTENSKDREENDYYATEPLATELLLKLESFNNNIWECACGENHIVNVLRREGYNVKASDLIKRVDNIEQLDFLKCNEKFNGDIITNPPYKYATEFIYKALDLVEEGSKVAMFLKIQFLEGKKRKELFINHPPKTVYVSSSRLGCAKNGEFEKHSTRAMAFAWYIWQKGYQGETTLRWFN